MIIGSWQRRSQLRLYSRLNEAEDKEEVVGNSLRRLNYSPDWLIYCLFTLLATTVTLAGLAGYLFYRLHLSSQSEFSQFEGGVAQGSASSKSKPLTMAYSLEIVNIGTIKKSFHYNTTFAAPPPENGGPEPIWDSMIPSMSNTLQFVRPR